MTIWARNMLWLGQAGGRAGTECSTGGHGPGVEGGRASWNGDGGRNRLHGARNGGRQRCEKEVYVNAFCLRRSAVLGLLPAIQT